MSSDGLGIAFDTDKVIIVQFETDSLHTAQFNCPTILLRIQVDVLHYEDERLAQLFELSRAHLNGFIVLVLGSQF